MTIKLYEHNMKAYRKAVKLLESRGKTAVIHPTGSGKSFIAFKLAEVNPDKLFLWLSPSKHIFDDQINNLLRMYPEANTENIKFCTYQRLCHMNDNEVIQIKADYIILDEFHRCGASTWGAGVSKLLNINSNAKVLGLSATHIRYLDGQRDMAKELFDGCVAGQITLGEAIVKGIIKAPTYIKGIYSYEAELMKYHKWIDSSDIAGVTTEAIKYMEKLKRQLNNSAGIDMIFSKHIRNKKGKYLVFCANNNHMNEMIKCTLNWMKKIDRKPNVYTMYSRDKKSLNSLKAFREDDSNHLKLLFSIDMLNEGVHIDNLDGVILYRATISPIVYKQQIGRALCVSDAKEPLIFDLVNNFEALCSVDVIIREMQEAINAEKRKNGKRNIVCENFILIDEAQSCIELFQKMDSILQNPWNHYYAKAKEYYKKHGNLEVPLRFVTDDGFNLGKWVRYMRLCGRDRKTYYHITDEQIAKLSKIGMRWERKNEAEWKQNYEAAKVYYEKHGNINFTCTYVTSDGIQLGRWLAQQRTNYRKKSRALTEEKMKMLEDLNIVWNMYVQYTDKYVKALREYYLSNGDINVNGSYITNDGVQLGWWIKKQMAKKRDGSIKPFIEALLNECGIEWSLGQVGRWERGFEYAKKTFESTGNVNVPINYQSEDGFNTGIWISKQKESYKAGRLSDDQIEKLESLEITWRTRLPWDEKFNEAVEYYNLHGDIEMRISYVSPSGFRLGDWINRMRNEKEKLSEEQIARLDALNMHWGSKDERVFEPYRIAIDRYYEEHGEINDIPGSYLTSNGYSVAAWLRNARAAYRKGKLPTYKIEYLNKLGFQWVKRPDWDISYENAKAYYLKYHDLNVPNDYVAEDGRLLGKWICSQRYLRKLDKLSEERIEKLDQIGMEWKKSYSE